METVNILEIKDKVQKEMRDNTEFLKLQDKEGGDTINRGSNSGKGASLSKR